MSGTTVSIEGLRKRNTQNQSGLSLTNVPDDSTIEGDTEPIISQEQTNTPNTENRPTHSRTSSTISGSRFAGARDRMRERMKSPLMGSLKLDDLRENITQGVEVK